ncbi:MAG: hypothetical protein PVJ41_05935 [Desulfobacterales bacterium]|jgi:hypothetical protein
MKKTLPVPSKLILVKAALPELNDSKKYPKSSPFKDVNSHPSLEESRERTDLKHRNQLEGYNAVFDCCWDEKAT